MPLVCHHPPAQHAARKFTPGREPRAHTLQDVWRSACPNQFSKCQSILQSSSEDLHDFDSDDSIFGYSNGFVHAVITSYSAHHHLTIRPEDFWISILTQLSFYIKAHAEELRHLFVSPQGQKNIQSLAVGNKHNVDFSKMAQHMTTLMSTHLKDPELLQWIMPDFTTTTEDDQVVAAILMIGVMQKPFAYGARLACGLPSGTLLGERSD